MPNLRVPFGKFLDRCPSDVEVLAYESMTKPFVWRCVRCSKVHTSDVPSVVIRRKVNCRCDGFAGSVPKSVFVERMRSLGIDYEVLEYKALGKKATFSCVEGHIFEAIPFHILNRRNSCLVCSKSNRSKSSEQRYRANLLKAYPNISLVGPYLGAKVPSVHRCTCGYEWSTLPIVCKNRVRKAGCKYCNYEVGGPRLKEVTFGSRQLLVQGFEDLALEFLETKLCPEQLSVSKADGVPYINYFYKRKYRVYRPDFYYEPSDCIIEVKSLFTLLSIDYSKTVAKAKACLAQGFRFRLVVPSGRDKNGKVCLYDIPRKWYELSRKELGKHLVAKHPKSEKAIRRFVSGRRNVFSRDTRVNGFTNFIGRRF